MCHYGIVNSVLAKGGEFGVTEATLSGCVTGVQNHITGLVNEYSKQQSRGAPVAQQYRTVAVSNVCGGADDFIDLIYLCDLLLYMLDLILS